MIRELNFVWCRLLTRLASLDGRHLCAAWERCDISIEQSTFGERFYLIVFSRWVKPGSWRTLVWW